MKILFAQIITGLSGSEKYFIEIMPLLRQRGVDCEFLCVHIKANKDAHLIVTNRLEELGVPVHLVESKNTLNLGLLKKINRIIKKGNYDFIHSHLIHSDVWMVLTKIFFNRKLKILSTKHGFNDRYTNLHGFNPDKRLYQPFYFASLFVEPWLNHSFAVSKAVRKLYIGQNISKPEKVDVVYHGFKYNFQADEDKDKYREAEHQLVIVGRLEGYKGHQFIFEALQKMGTQFPNLKLLVIGSGGLEAELKQSVKEMEIEDKVVFKGFQTAVLDYMSNSDIVLIPSKSEGFGLVFMEAFEVKTPVIGFDVPAGNELIVHNESGLLVKAYDTQELADQIAHLLNHPEEGKRLAENAHQRLKTFFTPERMVEETIAIYEKMV